MARVDIFVNQVFNHGSKKNKRVRVQWWYLPTAPPTTIAEMTKIMEASMATRQVFPHVRRHKTQAPSLLSFSTMSPDDRSAASA